MPEESFVSSFVLRDSWKMFFVGSRDPSPCVQAKLVSSNKGSF